MGFALGNNERDSGELKMSDHKHGEMKIEDHERTFVGFIRWSKNVAIFSIGILIFLAIFNT